MKRRVWVTLAVLGLFALAIIFLNIKVTTLQGINYQKKTITIPLYLKLLDFFDRHFNYQQLLKRIVNSSSAPEDKAMRIFQWSYEHIHKVPEGLDIVDDHVWHIIIRGYGTQDQSADVFTTLCNYVRMPAFFSWVKADERRERIVFSLVRIKGEWRVFDAYRGVYFLNSDGGFADVGNLKEGEYFIKYLEPRVSDYPDYQAYLANLDDPDMSRSITRPQIQSPWRRLGYQLKKWLH